jgi:hypothetical protein
VKLEKVKKRGKLLDILFLRKILAGAGKKIQVGNWLSFSLALRALCCSTPLTTFKRRLPVVVVHGTLEGAAERSNGEVRP